MRKAINSYSANAFPRSHYGEVDQGGIGREKQKEMTEYKLVVVGGELLERVGKEITRCL